MLLPSCSPLSFSVPLSTRKYIINTRKYIKINIKRESEMNRGEGRRGEDELMLGGPRR
jgi:hypothetical protein